MIWPPNEFSLVLYVYDDDNSDGGGAMIVAFHAPWPPTYDSQVRLQANHIVPFIQINLHLLFHWLVFFESN